MTGYGTVVDDATPPIRAVAVVVVADVTVAFASVPANRAVALHLDNREDPTNLDDYGEAHRPTPLDESNEYVDEDEDPHVCGTARRLSWATVTVAGNKVARFAVREGEATEVYLRREDDVDVNLTEPGAGDPNSTRDSGGKRAENPVPDGGSRGGSS